MRDEEVRRCLSCYEPLSQEEMDFHAACSRKFFGTPAPPELPYSIDQVNELAARIVRSQVTVTGAQPKLSLHLERGGRRRDGAGMPALPRDRLTIVGLWGGFIFKPPSEQYAELPEIEDLTMHLAEIAGIATVPHTLIRFKSGELSYITRRIDRKEGSNEKIHMEDMCQLTERLTEEKYRGSMEQIGKVILAHSSNPGIDVISLFEITLFSFLVGNADMHLKNFSLIRTTQEGEEFIALTPAYDLVATKLVLPADKDQLALQMNGRRSNIGMGDFNRFASYLRIHEKAKNAGIERIKESLPHMEEFVSRSFVSGRMMDSLVGILKARAKILGLL